MNNPGWSGAILSGEAQVPGAYYSRLPFISKDAHGRRAQGKKPGSRRRQTKPTGCQNPQDMAVSKQRYVASRLYGTINYEARTRGYLINRLASRDTHFPQRPVWPLLADVRRSFAFVCTIVPFLKAGLNLGNVAVTRKPARLSRALQRAGQNKRKPASLEMSANQGRPPLPPDSQRYIGPAGVSTCPAPLGFAVPNQPEFIWHRPLH